MGESDARRGAGGRGVLITGNWKMNLLRASSRALAAGVVRELADKRAGSGRAGAGAQVALAPPFTAIDVVRDAIRGSGVLLAAQDVAAARAGAHTGEVSAAMLAGLGCDAVLIGHSERRRLYREEDADVGAKFARLHELAAGDARAPRIVLCVGETLAEREAGRTMDVLRAQTEMVGIP